MQSDAGQPIPTRRAGAAQGLTLALIGFLPVLAILSLAPAVPTLIKHFAGTPSVETMVPLMVTAPGMMIALLAPVAGFAVDRYGRRRLMLAATLLYGVFGILPLMMGDLEWMFASRLAIGVSEAIIFTIVGTLFADYFTVDRRRIWLTVQGVIGPILGTGSIALAGWLTTISWNGAFLVYLLAFPLFFAVLLFLYEPAVVTHHQGSDHSETHVPFPWKVVATFFVVTLGTSSLYYVFIVQGGLAFDAIGVKSASRVGGLISICSLGVPVGAIASALLGKRMPSTASLLLCIGLLGAGTLGMGVSRDATMMTACGFVQQVGAGMTVPILILWVSQLMPPEHRGRGFGFWTCAFFAGQFTSPLVLSLFRLVADDLLGAFAISGGLALVVVGLAIALRIIGRMGAIVPKAA